MEYKIRRFNYRPNTIHEAIQQAIVWYIETAKQFPVGVLVNPIQYEAAQEAIPDIQADLVKKFDGRIGDLPVEQVGGVLAWEIGLVVNR